VLGLKQRVYQVARDLKVLADHIPDELDCTDRSVYFPLRTSNNVSQAPLHMSNEDQCFVICTRQIHLHMSAFRARH